MLDIKFKKCCLDCGFRKTYCDETSLMVGPFNRRSDTTIGCDHELVCGAYAEPEEDNK